MKLIHVKEYEENYIKVLMCELEKRATTPTERHLAAEVRRFWMFKLGEEAEG